MPKFAATATVYMKSEGCYHLAEHEWHGLRDAYMNGNAFYEGEDRNGVIYVIKLREVETIGLVSEEAARRLAMAELLGDEVGGDD